MRFETLLLVIPEARTYCTVNSRTPDQFIPLYYICERNSSHEHLCNYLISFEGKVIVLLAHTLGYLHALKLIMMFMFA